MRGLLRAGLALSVLTALMAGAALPGSGQAARPVTTAVVAAVRDAESDPALAGAHVGVAVVDPTDGSVLYAHDADGAYLPASTLKLLTTATALADLGPAFRPRTELRADGPAAGGVLRGTLYLVGGGDPLLSGADLDAAAAAVRAAGVVDVERLALDQSYFRGTPYPAGWSWDDLGAYYAPPITALSVDENALDVDIAPGAGAGAPANVRVEENGGEPFVSDRATTAPAGGDPTADCHVDPASGSVVVSGTVPAGGQLVQQGCAVTDPSAFAANVLVAALQAHGVRVESIVGAEEAPSQARVLWSHDGESVAELLAKMLPPSDNFIAETLCRQIARVTDPAGSFAACTRAETGYAASIGVEPRALSLHDGSGLSRYDLVTPRALALVLSAIARGPYARLVRGALPRPGVDGTLDHRFVGSPLAGRIFAKTGSMMHVDNLAGYVESDDRGELAFAVLINGFGGEKDRAAAQRAEERIVEAAAGL
ncbi:MAG TPA: D-alanyl-D-alanine carboxypeptidase/D-alanyl-D-alanine-endopeptidase [Candidatus Dormibacteraeota bacterium]|nr:D-alanyl-D-alanine carboxypeptidase/D-alanyl-D-alanine-endopeptidase [Candidatus Dormibacteraeota bacterium]